jgi:dienelactone hydrolase
MAMRQLIVPVTVAVALFLQSAVADELVESKEGPLAVETADDLSVTDPTRRKDLPYKVYYPRTGGPYPVILFSHGFGGNKDAFGPIGKHWASHGYVVIHPTHADGLNRRPRDPNRDGNDKSAAQPRLGGLLGSLNNPVAINDRVADLVLILDHLDRLPKSVPELRSKIDTKSIGVAGHSFGAYTTMLIGGVTVYLGNDKEKRFLDKRVRCILPISAQGTGQQGLTEKSWEALKLPMMTITGTRDRGASGQGVEWKKEPFIYSPKGDKYLVVIDGANHFSFGGSLGARGGDITNSVKLCSTLFWDAYLKDSEDSRKYLQSEKLVKDAGGKFTVEWK